MGIFGDSDLEKELKKQNQISREQLAAMRQREAELENSRKHQENLFLEQVRASQERASIRYNKLASDYEEKENRLRREADNLLHASLEERNSMRAQHDCLIKEKDATLEGLRTEANQELKAIQKMRDEETATFREELKTLNEDKLQKEKEHGEKLTTLNKDHAAEVHKMYEEIRAAERDARSLSEKALKDKIDNQALTFALLGNITQKNAIEKDSNYMEGRVLEARQTAARMEEGRMKIIEVILDDDDNKEKKKDSQIHLKMISDESGVIARTVENIKEALIKSNLSYEKKEAAKDAAILIDISAAAVHTEVTNLRLVMQQKSYKTDLADLDGLRGRMEELRSSIDAFPSLITQSLSDYVLEAIQNVNINNNSLPSAITGSPSPPSDSLYPSLEEK